MNKLSLLAADLIEHSEKFMKKRLRIVYAFNYSDITLDDLMKARRSCETCEHYTEKIHDHCITCLRSE